MGREGAKISSARNDTQKEVARVEGHGFFYHSKEQTGSRRGARKHRGPRVKKEFWGIIVWWGLPKPVGFEGRK